MSERPRERLRSVGASALSTRELLAILVGSGRAGRSAVGVAAELLAQTGGSLRGLASLPIGQLERTVGVGPAVSARVAASLELGRRMMGEGPAERSLIRVPQDVYDRCAPAMRDLPAEEFRVLFLNTAHRVTGEALITRGVLDASLVHPREVYRAAIAACAHGVILVHNHPSGEPKPSADDRKVTRQLVEAGKIVGIPVIDHVIVGDGAFHSFAERGEL